MKSNKKKLIVKQVVQQQHLRSRRERRIACDDSCDHYAYIGEGDAVCTKVQPPKLVQDDFLPAADYLWCGGNNK